MDQRLVRAAVDVNWRNLALGHAVFEAEGATFVRNTELPQIYDANFLFGIEASGPSDIDRLLVRARAELSHAVALTFRTGPFTPPAFEARLALEDYTRSEALVMLLEGPLQAPSRLVDVRPVAGESSWQDYFDLKALDWREQAPRRRENPDDLDVAFGLAAASRLKCPPTQYFLAYEDGLPAGHCSAWEGPDGVGQVEDLFVHPKYRRRGIATALLHACVAHARARGARAIVIVADPEDTPKRAYANMGWQPVAICRQYTKKLTAPV